MAKIGHPENIVPSNLKMTNHTPEYVSPNSVPSTMLLLGTEFKNVTKLPSSAFFPMANTPRDENDPLDLQEKAHEKPHSTTNDEKPTKGCLTLSPLRSPTPTTAHSIPGQNTGSTTAAGNVRSLSHGHDGKPSARGCYTGPTTKQATGGP